MSNVFGFIPEGAFLGIKNQLGGGDGYVTLNTTQTITGQKTFDVNTIFNYDIYVQSVHSDFQIITTYVSSENIYASNAYLFGDGTTQYTAYLSLPPGTYNTANIVVNSHGAISSISTGTSSTIASQILMTDSSSASYFPLCFATGSPDGAKNVYQAYTGATFQPSTSTLTTVNANVLTNLLGSNATFSGTLNAYIFSANFITGDLISNSTTQNFEISSGPGQTLDLYSNNGATHNLMCTGTYNRTYVPLQAYVATSHSEAITAYGLDTYQQIIFNADASASSWNPIVNNGYASIVARGNGQNVKSLAITLWSNTAMGLLLSPTQSVLRFGNQVITADGSGILFQSTNPVSVSGYTLPANDNSSSLATTAWVQSFIGAGSGPASSVQMTQNLNNTDFCICYSDGSPDAFKDVYQDYSDLKFNPSTGILTTNKINKVRFFGDPATFTIYCGYNRSTYPSYCTIYGMNAGENLYGGYNTFIGYRAGQGSGGTLTASNNTCIGTSAGRSLNYGTENVYIGYESAFNANGSSNTFIGSQSGNILNLNTTNTILIGRNVQPNSTLSINEIKIGDNTQTQFIQGQINYNTYFVNYLVLGPTSFNLPTVVPQVVFITSDLQNANVGIVLPALGVSNAYLGAHIIFRKLPLMTNVSITVAGGGQIIDYNALGPVSGNTFGFNTNYVYVDMVCSGNYWCVLSVI